MRDCSPPAASVDLWSKASADEAEREITDLTERVEELESAVDTLTTELRNIANCFKEFLEIQKRNS